MIKLDLSLINNVARAVDKKDARPACQVVHIEDDEETRTREYVATDGHILLRIRENIPNGEDLLKEHLNIVPGKSIKDKRRMELHMREGVAILGDYLFEVSEHRFPDWKKVFPANYVSVSEYIAFNPKYLTIAARFFDVKKLNWKPYHEGGVNPALWILGNKYALIMPLTLVD